MFYRSPRSRVSIAATPKTGRTSILTFLVDLENRLGAAEVHGNTPAQDLDKRLKPFVIGDDSAIGEGELRLATVRDPADRIASCWLDKLVDGSAVWQAKYQTEDWFPEDFRTPEAIEASFLVFLGALRGDRDLLHSDPHWAPQILDASALAGGPLRHARGWPIFHRPSSGDSTSRRGCRLRPCRTSTGRNLG
jgi:hypothetical protein